MQTVNLLLDDSVVAALHEIDQSVENAARELIVLELYRRGMISAMKASGMLGMTILDFVSRAGRLGIPYFKMTLDEWDDEVERIRSR